MTLVGVAVLVAPEICTFLLVISKQIASYFKLCASTGEPFSLGTLHNIYFSAEFVQIGLFLKYLFQT